MSDSITLLSDAAGNAMYSSLYEMQQGGLMCDTFIIGPGGQALTAHACVLAAASPFFKMRLTGWKQCYYTVRMEDIYPGGINSDMWGHILKFVYTGVVTVPRRELQTLYDVAIHLEMNGLMELCGGLLMRYSTEPTSYSRDVAMPTQVPIPRNLLYHNRDEMEEQTSANSYTEQPHTSTTSLSNQGQNQKPKDPERAPSLERVNTQLRPENLTHLRHESSTGLEMESKPVASTTTSITKSKDSERESSPEQVNSQLRPENLSLPRQEVAIGLQLDNPPVVSPPGSIRHEVAISSLHPRMKRNLGKYESRIGSPHLRPESITSAATIVHPEPGVSSVHMRQAISADANVKSVHYRYQETIIRSKGDLSPGHFASEGSSSSMHTVEEGEMCISNRNVENQDQDPAAHPGIKLEPHRGQLVPTTSTGAESGDDNRQQESKPFCCLTCGKAFSLKIYLRRHTQLHGPKKPFVCSYCHLSFSYRHVLENHVRIHTGEKPFECGFCGSRFRQKATLKTHEKIHTGEKPFECQVCHKKFPHRHTLRTHEKIHAKYPLSITYPP